MENPMRAAKLISTSFVVIAAIAAAMVMPAAALAGTGSATMTLGSYNFTTGKATSDPLSGTIAVTPGSSVTVTAPEYLYAPPKPPSTSPTIYEFIFWDANAQLGTKEKDTFKAPATATAFKATAWYLPEGGCSTTCTPEVTTTAFSLTNDSILPYSPIGAVSPASAKIGPETVSTTSAAVVSAGKAQITAAHCVGVCDKYSQNLFSTWDQFGSGTIANPVLTVPAEGGSIAIAFYKALNLTPTPPGGACGGLGEPPCPPPPM
jgi:hypothetical protein